MIADTIADGLSWNVIEISSGIISASIPTMGPVVHFFFGRFKSSTTSGSSSLPPDAGHLTIGSSKTRHTGSREWGKLEERRKDSKYGDEGEGSEIELGDRPAGTGEDWSSNEDMSIAPVSQDR